MTFCRMHRSPLLEINVKLAFQFPFIGTPLHDILFIDIPQYLEQQCPFTNCGAMFYVHFWWWKAFHLTLSNLDIDLWTHWPFEHTSVECKHVEEKLHKILDLVIWLWPWHNDLGTQTWPTFTQHLSSYIKWNLQELQLNTHTHTLARRARLYTRTHTQLKL